MSLKERLRQIPPPGPKGAWAAFITGVVGSVVTIVAALAAARGELGSGYVFLLFAFSMTTYTLILIYMLRIFSKNFSEFRAAIIAVQGEVRTATRSRMVFDRTLLVARDVNMEVSDLSAAPSVSEVLTFSRNAVRNLARAFSESLGQPCRVCVKQVETDGDEPYVKTIARSDRSVAAEIDIKHPISENTDFDTLRRGREAVWFCKDITQYIGYRTTSNFPSYKSTIVWPVVTRVRATDIPREGFVPVVAYLCIDSEVPNLFSFEEHVPLGWVVSDALARLYEAQRAN